MLITLLLHFFNSIDYSFTHGPSLTMWEAVTSRCHSFLPILYRVGKLFSFHSGSVFSYNYRFCI